MIESINNFKLHLIILTCMYQDECKLFLDCNELLQNQEIIPKRYDMLQ